MGWPQIAMIVLFSMDLGLTLVKNGEPKTGKYDFWLTLLADAIMIGLM